jgi:SLA1 homology domain 1, SHD1
VTGKLNGEAGTAGQILLAPPGFAVGGVQVGSGLWMDALRLIYMPIEGNKLQISGRQYSEWVGGRGGGTKEIVSDGGLIVGVAGSFKENMESLQFLYVEAEDLKLRASTTAESSGSLPEQEFRTWKSASGKFTITASLESFDGTEAKLVTKDGRHISVAIEKLSAEDQKHVKESETEAENPFKVENTTGQPSE